MTAISSEFPGYNIRHKPELGSSTVAKKDNKVFVNIVEDNILISDVIHITVRHSATIEEQIIVEVFQKLQKVKRSEINRHSTIEDNNLKNSFENYEIAMRDFSKIFKFRQLFTALELVTNIDGKTREDDDFDKEVRKLSGINSQNIKEWRQFYNRTKHVQRNSKDIDKLYGAETTLSETLLCIRKCVQSILLSKLK